MIYKNNWFTWFFDSIEHGPKNQLGSKFEIKLTPTITRPIQSYKEELLLNTAAIKDTLGGPFDLMFSGGVDSEVILRCHVELGIPINVFIFKYENDYNLFDLQQAIKICKELDVKLNIIDFNLKRFFENEAYDIWKTGYYLNAGRLPHMKMLDFLDNIPIMGDAEPWWEYDRSTNSWLYEFDEVCHSQTFYANSKGRLMLSDWYEYSPEVLLAHKEHPMIKDLRKRPGNSSIYEKTKYLLHQACWPEISMRPKYVGFEGTLPAGLNSSKPEFMLDFNRTYLAEQQSTSFYFTEDELTRALVSV
jgi:hypothetical protein